ncbi:hypothetical protein LWI28_005353 [Acer negundo]|uniref:Uncharacterized protein n=1 Tax=Acer negundo TaxID=4023 RepID=A0AAD5J493_ACENE|nr:hypothetical protein LWI28_005353 [Acer negundo]
MLHLAAKYPNPPSISNLPGIALEMQQELLMFNVFRSHLLCFNHHHTRILSVSRKIPPTGSPSLPDVSKHHNPLVDLSKRSGSGGGGKSVSQPSAGVYLGSNGVDLENPVETWELCEFILGHFGPVYRYPGFAFIGRNASPGLCQCEKDEWKAIQKEGIWNYIMSPYEERYVDVKFDGKVSGLVSVAVVEDFQGWRLFLLASGFVMLLLAPNGMKLLPIGRKNIFYLSVYGSVLGAGCFLLHHFSMLVHSLLENFGPRVEMHTSVSILLLLLIIFTGAALGFWAVRKFAISEDGTVDVQFVKWSMQIMATTAIFQVCYHIGMLMKERMGHEGPH